MSDETFDGNTVEAALEKAAEKLGARPEDLQYEVVEERTKDFWGLDDDQFVRVRVWLTGEGDDAPADSGEAPFLEGAPEAEEPVPSAEEPFGPGEEEFAAGAGGPPETLADEEPEAQRQRVVATAPGGAEEAEIDDPLGEIARLVERIFDGMDFDCNVEVSEEADAYMALISGEDKEYLLEGHGRALSALELILNHAFRHRLANGKKVRVDAGDFRSRREEELRDLAYQVAHSAKQSGSIQETQPLNPYERRLVHLALAEDNEVTTRSRGSGFLKNVQIIPRRSGRG